MEFYTSGNVTPASSQSDAPLEIASGFPSRPFHYMVSASISKTELPIGSAVLRRQYFHSRRIEKDKIEKPWLAKKDPREKWVSILPLVGLTIGLLIAGYFVYRGVTSAHNPHKYCLILDETFASETLDSNIWTKEVEVGGFGNGQFEETTDTDENAFIKDGRLHLKPTLQDQSLLEHDGVLNLTRLGTCTGSNAQQCVSITSKVNGTIINPVKSARLTTKKGATLKYGRMEIVAKMPSGDWLWPAIWMMPLDSKYGPWPASGEIDIAESRGNSYTYKPGGDNIVSSALHWGPTVDTNMFWKTMDRRKAPLTTYSRGFHKFGLEWSQDYLFTYVDNRLYQIYYTDFEVPFWQRGSFPRTSDNGTRLENPWQATGRANTPFDQQFYLILSLGVGSTNGWFLDGAANKPWVDGSPSARRDFWEAREKWLPTWQNGGAEMIIDSVKMWQQCD